jgi:hypothetical protein
MLDTDLSFTIYVTSLYPKSGYISCIDLSNYNVTS